MRSSAGPGQLGKGGCLSAEWIWSHGRPGPRPYPHLFHPGSGGERPAEAAALVRLRQVHQVQALHAAQQASLPVTELQQPHPMARGVVRHGVREIGADLLGRVRDAQDVHQQFGQLEGFLPDGDARSSSPESPVWRATIRCWCFIDATQDPDEATATS